MQQTSPVEIGWSNGDYSYPMSTEAPIPDRYTIFFFFLIEYNITINLTLCRNFIQSMFAISYMYYSAFGTFLTVFIGTIVSWLLATEDDVCEEKMLNPYLVSVMKFCRSRRTKDVRPPEVRVSTIEMATEFSEQVNHAYDSASDSKTREKSSGLLEMITVTPTQPKESYRKITE